MIEIESGWELHPASHEWWSGVLQVEKSHYCPWRERTICAQWSRWLWCQKDQNWVDLGQHSCRSCVGLMLWRWTRFGVRLFDSVNVCQVVSTATTWTTSDDNHRRCLLFNEWKDRVAPSSVRQILPDEKRSTSFDFYLETIISHLYWQMMWLLCGWWNDCTTAREMDEIRELWRGLVVDTKVRVWWLGTSDISSASLWTRATRKMGWEWIGKLHLSNGLQRYGGGEIDFRSVWDKQFRARILLQYDRCCEKKTVLQVWFELAVSVQRGQIGLLNSTIWNLEVMDTFIACNS